MTEITNHHAAIATIGEAVTGITKAFATAPAKLDTDELPALYTLTGTANYDYEIEGDDSVNAKRVYRIQVAVIPTGQANPSERETACRPILEAVVAAFQTKPSLGKVPYVQNTKVISDSGVVILPEFGMKFVGFEVRLEVEYILNREFAEGE